MEKQQADLVEVDALADRASAIAESVSDALPGGVERPDTGNELMTERTPPPPEVLALGHRIVDVLVDRQAGDVILLDISPLASFADYFVIATGTSERHVAALRDAVDEALDEDGLQPLQIEGVPDSGWVLMDYGDVIVHLFDGKTRDYYRLERIWAKAPMVVRVL